MRNKREDLVYAVFIADAVSLGSHWVYDTDKIKENYSGMIKEYRDPMSKFHQGKKAGDFTHYGEQAYALLKSLNDNQSFDLKRFRDDWIEYLENNEMYMDHSMTDAIEKFKDSDSLIGSKNVELGGIARSLPVFLVDDLSEKEFLNLVHLTHNGEIVDQTAEYFYQVLQDVLAGADYKKALENHKKSSQFIETSFNKIGSKDQIVKNADQRGQGCSIEQGIPIVLDIIWNADNLLEALTLNIRAGGDSAARAMLIAAVMAADEGLDSIPKKLITDLNKSDSIKKFLGEN